MSNTQRTYYRDSNCFKEKVVQEVSTGKSISEVCRCYGVKGTNIRVKMRSEEDRIKALESENKRLKIALADAVLAKDVLECLIEEVDSHYGTDVKTKFGHQLSVGVRKKSINR